MIVFQLFLFFRLFNITKISPLSAFYNFFVLGGIKIIV
jgi:hypothetical protein